MSTDHDRVELADGWTLWPWALVRGAGFPADGVLALASPEAAEIADEVNALAEHVSAQRARVVEELTAAAKDRDFELAGAAQRMASSLQRGKSPDPSPELDERFAALRELRQLDARLAERHGALARAYADGEARIAQRLRELGTDPRFREALLWQNRHALHTGVDGLLAHPDATNRQARKKQHLVARYLQRYSVKNDTIGFFGPMGWGQVRADGSAGIAMVPGRSLLAERQVYLEDWAMDALAARIASLEGIKPHLAPRLLPSVAAEGTTLRYGVDRTAEVPELVTRLLVACDGNTPACQIARTLMADPALEVEDEAEVYDLLEQLEAKKLVTWTLELGALAHPDRELRQLVERIGDPAIRERALAMLARVEAARDEVAKAAGDPPRLERALDALDATFREVTGSEATRRAGETYAARTSIHEDCVRDIELTVGRPLLDKLGPVFALIARSARWFTHELARWYRDALRERYTALAADRPGPIGYLRFLTSIEDLLPLDADKGRAPGFVSAISDELARRWATILDLDLAQRHVQRSASALASQVADAFVAPGPGWPGARHVSPDLLVAAPSLDAIARNEFTVVLGETHLLNSVLTRAVMPHGPRGADLNAAYEHDLPLPRVLPIESRQRQQRAQNLTWSLRDYDLLLGSSKGWRAAERTLRAADLVVDDASGRLVVRDQRHGIEFDAIVFFESFLAVLALNHFHVAPSAPHVPRITIDDVVVSRETWRLSSSELPAFRKASRGHEQYAACRAWVSKLGLPRFVFVRIPEERKPMFVDFTSPLYVEMFAKLLREASAVTISEMLPDIDDSWLVDADARRYTCELRMVAVDPIAWAPSSPDQST